MFTAIFVFWSLYLRKILGSNPAMIHKIDNDNQVSPNSNALHKKVGNCVI